MLDRIYADLMIKMTNLEEFLDDSHLDYERKNKLITQEITIRYQLNGKDMYLDLGYNDVMKVIEEKAVALRRELSKVGICKEAK